MIVSDRNGPHCLKAGLMRSAAVAALLLAAQPAMAQTSDAPAEQTEQAEAVDEATITVTGTRLNRANVPTPVMSLDASALAAGAPTNIVEALNDYPQFRASLAPQSTGTSIVSGAWNIDLRGLGQVRTLTLLDGRRFVASVNRPDASIIPSVLIRSVDVVSGSASAAWGSNAVAGVVNLMLDDDLEGVRAGAQFGISERGDGAERRFEFAAGSAFANGRGHVVFGAEVVEADGAVPRNSRSNVGRWAVVSNPTANQRPFIIAPDVGFATVSPGGLIVSGVNAGRAFNPDGTLRPFDLGRVSSGNSIGGEASSFDDVAYLIAPTMRYSALARGRYEITDGLELTAELLHGRISSNYSWIPDYNPGNITVSIDNAFLPAAIRAQMAAANETSFRMGRLNADFAFITMDYRRETTQANLALKADLGGGWTADAYYGRGVFSERIDLPNSRIAANFANAVDSVISPSTGQPICRIALASSTTNCVPINLFGEGRPSAAAQNYVNGTAMQRTRVTLDTAGLTLRGEAGDIGAGPIALAAGIEGRREVLIQRPGSTDLARGFTFFNNPAAQGRNTTKEAFAEVQLPLLRDVPLLRRLELNAAARITDDRTGSIWSWKVGASNEIIEGVRLRFTTSRDIRSPNLVELFQTPLEGLFPITDPATGTGYTVRGFTGGNAALEPEASRTTTAGITISPRAIQGLNFSIDYFNIDIENAIAALSVQQVITLCGQNFSTACSAITRGADGLISTVSATQLNLVNFQTRGVDFVANYAVPVSLPGELSLRAAVTWTTRFRTDNGLTQVNFLGSQGTSFAFGVPKVAANAAITYETDRFRGNLSGRFISAGEYDATRNDIENNRIPAYAYVDLGLAAKVALNERQRAEIYFNISNLFDKAPPIGSQFSSYYDVLGRYFAVGVRTRF